MRRQPSDRIESLGNDYKLWDRRWWGTRDHEKHAAELAMNASMPKEYLPVAMPMIPDHVTAFRLDTTLRSPDGRRTSTGRSRSSASGRDGEAV